MKKGSGQDGFQNLNNQRLRELATLYVPPTFPNLTEIYRGENPFSPTGVFSSFFSHPHNSRQPMKSNRGVIRTDKSSQGEHAVFAPSSEMSRPLGASHVLI